MGGLVEPSLQQVYIATTLNLANLTPETAIRQLVKACSPFLATTMDTFERYKNAHIILLIPVPAGQTIGGRIARRLGRVCRSNRHAYEIIVVLAVTNSALKFVPLLFCSHSTAQAFIYTLEFRIQATSPMTVDSVNELIRLTTSVHDP